MLNLEEKKNCLNSNQIHKHQEVRQLTTVTGAKRNNLIKKKGKHIFYTKTSKYSIDNHLPENLVATSVRSCFNIIEFSVNPHLPIPAAAAIDLLF